MSLITYHSEYRFDVELQRQNAVATAQQIRMKDRFSKTAQPKRISQFSPSQYLANSSLGASSQMLDAMVNPHAALEAAVERSKPISEKTPELDEAAEGERGSNVYVVADGELDLDDLNRHECMVWFRQVVSWNEC